MRWRALAGAVLLAAGLAGLGACAGGVDPEEARERSRVRQLRAEIDEAEERAVRADDPADREHWLRLYDERRGELNRLYDERGRRLGIEREGAEAGAADCTSRVVDDAIETTCR